MIKKETIPSRKEGYQPGKIEQAGLSAMKNANDQHRCGNDQQQQADFYHVHRFSIDKV